MTPDSIRCPKCGQLIPVTETLHHQLSEQTRAELRRELVEEQKALAAREKEIKAKEEKLLASQRDLERRVEKRLAAERGRLGKEALAKARAEASVEVKALRQAAAEKDAKLHEAQEKELQLRKEKRELESEKKQFELTLTRKLDEERQRIRDEAVKTALSKAREEVSIELVEHRQASAEKDQKLKEAQEKELTLRKEKRELEAARKEIELTTARKLDDDRQRIREETAKQFLEEHRLKDAEKDRKLQEALRMNEDLRRKLEQGSQQAQGEVLEVELETALRNTCPLDEIEPVATGMRGADILQRVRTRTGLVCGCILWETKHSKTWSDSWIAKLKDDQQGAKADVAVLVTETLPKDIADFGMKDGVWVTAPRYVTALVMALRSTLSQVAVVKAASASKNETVETLFQYLTGPEFRHRVEAIIRGFSAMKEELDAEKRVTQRRWAKREKQLDHVLRNTSGMYGDLQGLLGSAIQPIAALEAGEVEEEAEVAEVNAAEVAPESEEDIPL